MGITSRAHVRKDDALIVANDTMSSSIMRGRKQQRSFAAFTDPMDPDSIEFAEQDSSEEESAPDQTHCISTEINAEEVNSDRAQVHVGVTKNASGKQSVPDISLRVLAIKITNPTSKLQAVVNVLLDEGADRSYLDEAVATRIGLRGAAQNITINGAGET
jgi:hypothetical protein